jgi:hypothetical protein
MWIYVGGSAIAILLAAADLIIKVCQHNTRHAAATGLHDAKTHAAAH